MPNGELRCWWLSGSDNERSTDNNVLASRSTDRGKTWGEPQFVKADPPPVTAEKWRDSRRYSL